MIRIFRNASQGKEIPDVIGITPAGEFISANVKPKYLETCIDCGKPITKPSPVYGRLCDCRNAESE